MQPKSKNFEFPNQILKHFVTKNQLKVEFWVDLLEVEIANSHNVSSYDLN